MKFIRTTKVAVASLLGVICLFSFYLSLCLEKSRGMELSFYESCYDIIPVHNPNCLTVILSKDKKVFYYKGGDLYPVFEEEKINFTETELSYGKGIEKVLTEHNSVAEKALAELEKKKENMADSIYRKKQNSINYKNSAVTVFIKTDEGAKYGDVVKLIDILRLKKISKFHMQEITAQELKTINEINKKS